MVERQISSTYRRKKQPNFTTHSFCKESEELDLIQQACTITEKDSEEFYLCGTQCDEYEIEAEFIHEFMRNRSSFSYTPIIGSGNNANVLHYIENNQQCKSGDLN
jgi:Xaa-Pro aminopeptidase